MFPSLGPTLRTVVISVILCFSGYNFVFAQSDLEKAAKALQIFSDTLNKIQNPNQQTPQNPYAKAPPAAASTPSRPDGSTPEIEWGTVFFPNSDDLFTSLIFSMRKVDRSSPYFRLLNPWKPEDFIGDPNSFMAVLLRPKISLGEIVVTLSAEPYLRPSSITLRGLQAGAPKACKPSLNWDYSSLRNIPQSCPVTLVTEITSPDGRSFGRSQRQISVRSPNECPITPIPKATPFDFLLTGYVNEDSPLVDFLLQEALGSKIVGQFTGYQGGRVESVYNQLFSIWHVLQRRGVRYSNIATVSMNRGQGYGVQHIRFMEDSLLRQQANCIDGAVLFASVCQRIGLHSSVVLLGGPGGNHAIVGIRSEPNDGSWILLDTTAMKDAQFAGFGVKTASWQNFNSGLSQGIRVFEDSRGNGFEPKIVDVQAARGFGIVPIPLMANR
jgi:hypothetical protein